MAERDSDDRRDQERGAARYGEGRSLRGEWGGHGSSGLDYRVDADRGRGYGAYGSIERESQGRERGVEWNRPDDDRLPIRGSSGRRGSGEWGNQGYGVAPHLLLGGGPDDEADRRNRGPKGWKRSDERIHEDVCERLMGESGVDPSDVSVQVANGVVTLTGTVPTRQMKYRIEELADRCVGVQELDNRIRIDRGDRLLGDHGGRRHGSDRGSLLGRLFGFTTGSRVSEVMTPDPQVVSPDESVARAAQLMKEHDIGAIPVCNGRRLVGMITDRDIVIRAVADGKQVDTAKVSEAMTSRVHWCYADDRIEDVLEKMGGLQVRRIPVIDRTMQLVGIVALADLAHENAAEVQDTLQEISQPR
jgi:CBS domain-containing protein